VFKEIFDTAMRDDDDDGAEAREQEYKNARKQAR
jgi:hypothetical protein